MVYTNRVSAHPNRRKLKKISETASEMIVDIEYADEATSEGTKINADLLNSFETKIDAKVSRSELLDLVYPVGAIYLSISSANPKTIFGGEWERWANGKFIVGVDANDTDFSTVQKSGGSKQVQSHTHTFTTDTTELVGDAYIKCYLDAPLPTGIISQEWQDRQVTPSGSVKDRNAQYKINATHNHTGTTNATGDKNNNLPPYITCYIWRRKS